MNGEHRIVKPVALGVLFVLWGGILFSSHAAAQEESAGPEAVVRQLYDLVTFDAGERPDWAQVRDTFLDQAVVVLRTSRDSTSVFSLEGFVEDFIRFIDGTKVKEVGFEEKIVRMHSVVFGDMASILVLYEAHIPGSPRPPQQGVDSVLLSRRSEGWKIVAITNEIPTSERPLPAELRE